MVLTPSEIQGLLHGEFPQIIRPFVEGEDCPFEPAETIALRTQSTRQGPVAQVSITIIGRKRGKKGEWIAEYSLRDDRPLYLRHGIGLTRSASQSVDPEASITDEKTLAEYAAQARLKQSGSSDKLRRKRQNDAARSELTEALSGLEGPAREAFLAEFQRLCRKRKLKEVA